MVPHLLHHKLRQPKLPLSKTLSVSAKPHAPNNPHSLAHPLRLIRALGKRPFWDNKAMAIVIPISKPPSASGPAPMPLNDPFALMAAAQMSADRKQETKPDGQAPNKR